MVAVRGKLVTDMSKTQKEKKSSDNTEFKVHTHQQTWCFLHL